MLTINPGSSCDVCAEEYGPQCPPHSIPCGHVLCASCCSTIVEKTSTRLAPVCPFCREQFTSDSIRLIRMDFMTSGWSTPRRLGGTIEAHAHGDLTGDVLTRKTERLLHTDSSCARTRAEARRLEDKVAKVAAKKCSVDEVTALHKELQEWLSSDSKSDDQASSLFLSAALLRAILMNHVAHSEASKLAKSIEADLKGKLDDLEITNGKLEAELRRERLQYAQKAQECQNLRTELSRLKALASIVGVSSTSQQPEPRPTTPTSPAPTTSTSPTPYSSAQSPLSRFNSIHVRSASVSSRPTTPATPSPSYRSYTPSPAVRPITPHTPSIRSYTPSIRSYTPAPSTRSQTPAPSTSMHRSQTPAPPLPSSKQRRLSTPSAPSPPKMMSRSVSEEKPEQHERWIPHMDPDSPPTSPTSKSFAPMMRSLSVTSRSLASAAAARYRSVRSPSPNDN